MKSGNQMNSDESLDKALREWRVDDPLAPRFSERVWRRIARQEAPATESVWTRFSNWLGRATARPSLATSYVAVLVLTGLAAGYWQARVDNARTSEQLGARYVQMMDPYRAPRH
jgi:hypothetical protein